MFKFSSDEVKPLSLIKPGENVRLVSITGGDFLQSRLVSMGLFQGTPIDVVKNKGNGPVIVSVKGSRLVLGRGMAHKIMVASSVGA
ncbi:MAG TPA: FeoA family protein [archaeon]|nr:FeoA family protein [archaeon]